MVMLGNLTITQLEDRTGWTFEKDDRQWLEEHRTSLADFDDDDKFHIFDIPQQIVVGSKIKDEFIKLIMKYENATPSKARIGVGVKN